jgi:hypothetical protein
MSFKTILNNAYATVVYYPDQKIIKHTIHQPIGSDVRDVLLAGYETLKANGATKWLSDDRANGPLSPEDTEWASTVWFPQVRAAGWKYWGAGRAGGHYGTDEYERVRGLVFRARHPHHGVH